LEKKENMELRRTNVKKRKLKNFGTKPLKRGGRKKEQKGQWTIWQGVNG